MKSKILLIFIFTILLGSFCFAAEEENEHLIKEQEKMRALTVAYREITGLDLGISEIDCPCIGTILRQEPPRTIDVHSCTPKVREGIVDPRGAAPHLTSASVFIQYDPAATPQARQYISTLKDVGYVAFGNTSSSRNQKGYHETLTNTFVVPITDPDLILLIAKGLHLNSTLVANPVSFQFEGEFEKQSHGRNLPWNNWNIKNLKVIQSSKLRELYLDVAQAGGLPSSVAVAIHQSPLALLDRFGRVIVGQYDFGNIDLDSSRQDVQSWKANVKTQAQALWAAKFLSSNLTVKPSALIPYLTSNAKSGDSWVNFNWSTADWPKNLPLPPKQLTIRPYVSTTFGQTKGSYRNPNHKFVLKLTDPKNNLNFQLTFQNNLKDLVGRPIPFGTFIDSDLFAVTSGEYSDTANVKIGFNGVTFYDFSRSVPHGVLIVHDYKISKKEGALISLNATIEMDIDEWADVHPAGHAISQINFRVSKVQELSQRPFRPDVDCGPTLEALTAI